MTLIKELILNNLNSLITYKMNELNAWVRMMNDLKTNVFYEQLINKCYNSLESYIIIKKFLESEKDL